MPKFEAHNFFYEMLKEAVAPEEEMQPNQPAQPQQQTANQTPDQVANQQKQAQPTGTEVFRKLQGQVISGVEFQPNGSEGGAIKIKVKNSYQPFVVSWVNGQVTVTDMSGRTIMLSDNNPQ
jgi:hypothetical protein